MIVAPVPSLTVVGAINVDLTARVERAPAAGETVADGVLQRGPGGKGANQAVAAARLGARVRLVGAVGDDPDGRGIRAQLAGIGVDATGVQTADAATGTALIVVDATGENSIVVCAGANAAIDPAALGIAAGAAVLVQLEVSDAVVSAAASAAGFLALNAAPARPLPTGVLERCDLVIVNETEYAQLPEVHDAALLCVTLGAAGARLYRRGELVASAPAVATEVRNTVGAGDAFCAAVVTGLLRGDEPALALSRACAVGAAAVADAASQPALSPLDAYGVPA
ncbi:PfkB family carbohydrate kinase [Microbacterium trichothecenolyticum]|uniref:Ribokinase n=1 Tax=Microbacterium trichothecenolyticum TaxID=69370 RepID=A0ABU0TPF9_MICTR|nr:PfkB family carbohydrate kinase [Microbacterium trichothecenolyticum]MDQ1121558.1 ribokinase [Microbacterium trichothecenolyticum]